VPQSLVSIFTEQELELLISGLPDIDVDDWKSNTEYTGYTASSPQIMWFWRAVRSFDKEERAKLLQFATGTSKVPLNGFKELEGMNGFSRFNIHKDYGGSGGAAAAAGAAGAAGATGGAGRRLPSAHTCFNQLDLPLYDSYEVLREQLIVAINQGTGHFGFV
jgi:E3 ubiquitin-protein ligase HUWE1